MKTDENESSDPVETATRAARLEAPHHLVEVRPEADHGLAVAFGSIGAALAVVVAVPAAWLTGLWSWQWYRFARGDDLGCEPICGLAMMGAVVAAVVLALALTTLTVCFLVVRWGLRHRRAASAG